MTKSPAKLSVWRLAAATYFLVAGGPYGLEELIKESGFAYAAVTIVATPVFFSLPTALMVGELGAAIPEEGGYYAWVKRALGPFWGFTEGWLSLCASFFDMAIYPTLFLTYLGQLVPGVAQPGVRFAAGVAMIALCTLWNLRGARGVGSAAVVLSVVLLAPFGVLSVLGFQAATHASAVPDPSTNGGLGAGLLIAMWNFMGWDNASTFAGEVEQPQRTYPRAMAIAVVAVVVTYLVPVLAASHSGLGAEAWTTGSWAIAAARLGGVWLARAVVLGGVICGLGMYNALLLSYSRIPAVLATDGYLPAIFSRTNKRGVPVASVVACSFMYCAGLLLSFRKLVELDLLFYGASLFLEFAALVALRVREPALARPFRVPGGLIGAVALGVPPLILFVFALTKELSDGQSHASSFAAGAGALALGAALLGRRAAIRAGS